MYNLHWQSTLLLCVCICIVYAHSTYYNMYGNMYRYYFTWILPTTLHKILCILCIYIIYIYCTLHITLSNNQHNYIFKPCLKWSSQKCLTTEVDLNTCIYLVRVLQRTANNFWVVHNIQIFYINIKYIKLKSHQR